MITDENSVGSKPATIIPKRTEASGLHTREESSKTAGRTANDYDAHIKRVLCDNEQGFELLLDRIKQNIFSSKEAATFLKKRAVIEEEYARSMLKLSQTSPKPEGKDSSYGENWLKFCQLHEKIGQLRLDFGNRINELADEILNVSKNAERSRKQLKDAGFKQVKQIQEAEVLLEKSKLKYEMTSEEWERSILQMDQEQPLQNEPIRKLSNIFVNKKEANPQKLSKNEEEARQKAASANDFYKMQLLKTNTMRQQYFSQQLPQLIKALKDTNDECDVKLKQFLQKYTMEFENALVYEATTVCPLEKNTQIGLQAVVEQINPRKDFEDFMFAYLNANGRQIVKEAIQYTPYSMSQQAFQIIHPKPQFGVDLATLLKRDGGLIPIVLQKCIKAIEEPATPSGAVHKGLQTPGIYRVSGLSASIQKLRQLFDKEGANFEIFDHTVDAHVISGLLKLYFRELPDPVIPRSFYVKFMDAARNQDATMQLIKTHELVNELPDANYATLRALMAHLYQVQKQEAANKMGIQNLAIVWGPTLLDMPTLATGAAVGDLKLQSLVVEVILRNFVKIFDV